MRLKLEMSQQNSNQELQKIIKSVENTNDEDKQTGFINFAETREIAERVLSVFVWNGH